MHMESTAVSEAWTDAVAVVPTCDGRTKWYGGARR